MELEKVETKIEMVKGNGKLMITDMFGQPAHYGKNRIHFLCGGAIEALKTVPDDSVHCCVTSPPYFRLRDYQHENQIGMENTPEHFIDKLVNVFREVRRVLRPDGLCWINIGDSYAGSGKSGSTESGIRKHKQFGKIEHASRQIKPTKVTGNLKPKDMIGVPWMLAFALRDDGWYLRSDIIWSKIQFTPESVKDRPTKSYEHIFMISKSRYYFYNNEAAKRTGRDGSKSNERDVWDIKLEPQKSDHYATYPSEIPRRCIKASVLLEGVCSICGSFYKCSCDNSSITPPTVLDPFAGSCTTGIVASELSCNAIMIDIKEDYLQLGQRRLKRLGYAKLITDIVYI
jgi:site-specific DNA-methyltransferase (cytosine-N4-specific)